MRKLKGIIPPVPTPINSDETVDEKGLRKIIDYTVDCGFHGVFVCGTNGEGMALTQSERMKALKIALDEAKGRIPVLAGCMDTSTQRVINNINEFEKMGGKFAVVTAPFYASHNVQNETVEHFRKISESVNIDVLVYNIPPYVGYSIPSDVVKIISEFDHIIGYKDSSGNVEELYDLINYFKRTDFMVFEGKATQCALGLSLGADGIIPNISTVIPDVFNSIWTNSQNGNMELAAESQKEATLLLKSLFKTGNIISACKYLHSKKGLMSEKVCMPSKQLSDEEKQAIDKVILQYNI